MINPDGGGNRRSARAQGLPPPSPPSNPLDQLSNQNFTMTQSPVATQIKRMASSNASTATQDNIQSDDLISFDLLDTDDNSNHNSSDNLMSSTSSPLINDYWLHQQHHYNNQSTTFPYTTPQVDGGTEI